MRQRSEHSGAFSTEATRLPILIVALQPGRDVVVDRWLAYAFVVRQALSGTSCASAVLVGVEWT